MVRRLAAMPHPAIDDFYHVPNLVYTYPFPGTHFVMALISGLGGLDALFVYHKMRFFWGFAALLFVYLLARRIFESSLLGFLTGLTAAVFVLGGGFADAPGIDWGQLAPLSHPSDVAMNVLLPPVSCSSPATACKVKVAVRPASSLAPPWRWRTMVAMVQIRGIVQFLVYLGCFFAGLLLYRRDRVYLVRTVTLIVGSVVVTVAYLWFHRRAAVLIAPMVAAFRAELLATARSLTLAALVFPSRALRLRVSVDLFWLAPVDPCHGPAGMGSASQEGTHADGGHQHRRHLLVIRLPLLSLPFAYVTHWEILVFPLRNLAIFTYLLAGLTLYALCRQLGSHPEATIALASTALASACLVVILSRSAEFFGKHRDVYFVPVVALYILALTSLRSPMAGVWADRLLPESPRPIWKWTFALLVVLSRCGRHLARSGAWSIGSTHTGVTRVPRSRIRSS